MFVELVIFSTLLIASKGDPPVAGDLESTYNKTWDEMVGVQTYVLNLMVNGYINETQENVHQEIEKSKAAIETFKSIQENATDFPNLNTTLLKAEIIITSAKLLETLVIGLNYITSENTVPNDAFTRETLTKLHDQHRYLNELNLNVSLSGATPWSERTLDLIAYRVYMLDLLDSQFYIDRSITLGFANESEFGLHEKVNAIDENLNGLIWLKEKTSNEVFANSLTVAIKKFDTYRELSRLLEKLMYFIDHDISKMASPYFKKKLEAIVTNLTDRVRHVWHDDNDPLQNVVLDVFRAFSERVAFVQVLYDFRQLNMLLNNKTFEQVYSNDKEELHKIIKTTEKDYQELAGYNNTLEQFGFTLVEFSRAIGDFANFYDYFKVGEDGELSKEITSDQLDKIKNLVDSLNAHPENIKVPDADPIVKSMAEFSELYFEAISLKNDPKRNSSRALYLIGELENGISAVTDNAEREEVEKLRELFKKAHDEMLNSHDEKYKSILVALKKYAHYL
uniref:Uncharacterized protein n=1 Tax=Acrobeloides nanus TaxID=290746 RepID=A0A914E122_9BILA